MNNTIVVDWIQNTDIPLSSIASNTGVSKKTLYNLRSGKLARKSTLQKLYLVYEKEILLSNNKLQLEENAMNVDDFLNESSTVDKDNKIDAKYVIDLQKEQLEQKDKEIAMLKSFLDNDPFHSTDFTSIEPDFMTDVELKYTTSGLQRKLNHLMGSDIFVKYLDMTKEQINEIFDWGVWYPTGDHPSNIMLDKSSTKLIEESTRSFPHLFNSMKFFVGNFYHKLPIVYNYNNKKLFTHCAVKISWLTSPIKIRTKSVIITKEQLK